MASRTRETETGRNRPVKMRPHGTRYPPAVIPARLGLTCEPRRPYKLDPACVLHLTSERGTKWCDYSGKDNHGTLSGAVWSDLGRSGPAMYLNGISAFVDCGNDAELRVTDDFTVEAWANCNDITGALGKTIISKFKNVTTGTFSLIIDATTIYFFVDLVSAAWGPAKANTWYHLVGTFDRHLATKNIKLYVNGVLKDVDNKITVATTVDTPVKVGAEYTVTADFFPGWIDEVRIYNRVLTPGEILSLYEMGKP